MEIINNLKLNKSTGFSSVPNECFKYGQSKNTVKLIKVIIETVINYNIVPKMFNIGIIKLLVKDTMGNPDDPNNIRPITISDTLTSIYEKVLLMELNKGHKGKSEPFGFKESSCDHE